ncbi:hypothetical protein [Psychrobacter sp. I-STPA6b]|uniref:hypothetical protein n=1 Tax=Psychrobacter sp. I-STPA6b TaxID=2585718 RepID=UPI001D0C6AE7|nr:hypothetical protein [Psychrobacter sp. I-STPA6b]
MQSSKDITNNPAQQLKTSKKVSLVPKGITIGLAIATLCLSSAIYIFRLILGDDPNTVIRHALIIVPLFTLGVPLVFWLGALVMNKFKGMNIQTRNALTLGWLMACVGLLWLMGAYS